MTEAKLVTTQDLPTDIGLGRLQTYAPAGQARAEVLLSHGAGGGIEARDLAVLAHRLPQHGYRVHLLEQPWRVAGRRIATAPPTLDVGLLAALEVVAGDHPVVLGGRSAGARSACRCAGLERARELGVSGVLALSFPLHPPGKPEKSRLAELQSAGVPTLIVQGERDAMGRPEEFPTDSHIHVVSQADHGLKVPKRAPVGQDQAMAEVADAVLRWLAETGV